MICSAYVTYYYEHNETYNKRDELSKQIRHSVHTAANNYLKVSNIEPVDLEEGIKF